MSLWMNDGSLVLDSQGRLVNCADCPCEEEQTVDCSICADGVCWDADFSGAAPGNACCSSIGVIRFAFVNQILPTLCSWRKVVGSGFDIANCLLDYRLNIQIVLGNLRFTVTVANTGHAWSKTVSGLVCPDTVLLNGPGTGSASCVWPATLQLDKVNPC